MDVFSFEGVTALQLASGWARPEPGTLRWRTATRWLDGTPTPIIEWVEGGATRYAPAANILAIESAAPTPEATRPVLGAVADLLDGAGRPSFSSDDAARSNDLIGRPSPR